MTIDTPDHYGGKPIPEDAIEIALANAEREKEGEENTEVAAQETPLIGETNIDPSDYIQIPDRNILIAKEETLKGENWEDTHYKLAENGLFMPSPAIFMPYFVNVRDAAQGNLTLHDENDNPISRDEAKSLWKYLLHLLVLVYLRSGLAFRLSLFFSWFFSTSKYSEIRMAQRIPSTVKASSTGIGNELRTTPFSWISIPKISW